MRTERRHARKIFRRVGRGRRTGKGKEMVEDRGDLIRRVELGLRELMFKAGWKGGVD